VVDEELAAARHAPLLALEARHHDLLLAAASAIGCEEARHIAHRAVGPALRRASGEDRYAMVARKTRMRRVGSREMRAHRRDRAGKIGRRLASGKRGELEPRIFGGDEKLGALPDALLDPARELFFESGKAFEPIDRILRRGDSERAHHSIIPKNGPISRMRLCVKAKKEKDLIDSISSVSPSELPHPKLHRLSRLLLIADIGPGVMTHKPIDRGIAALAPETVERTIFRVAARIGGRAHDAREGRELDARRGARRGFALIEEGVPDAAS